MKRSETVQKKCKININDNIEIELTEYGRRLYCEVHSETGQEHNVPLKIQLWDFMNVFGGSFCTGSSPIVKDNIIIVKGGLLEE